MSELYGRRTWIQYLVYGLVGVGCYVASGETEGLFSDILLVIGVLFLAITAWCLIWAIILQPLVRAANKRD